MATTISTAPKLSPEQFSSLSHFSSLLHLLHHRSSRQHRHSIWYRHFSTFRRSLSRLLTFYTTLSSPSATHTQRLTFPAARTQVSQTLEFWQDVLVPKWEWVFGQVMADGRFAVLGVVLMGVLAGVCGILGVSARLEEVGQAEVERVLEEFGREGWEDDGEGEGEGEGEDVGVALERVGNEGEDVGSKVSRDAIESEVVEGKREIDIAQQEGRPANTTNAASSPPPLTEKPRKRTAADSKPKSTKKKRKKNGNAIDDIFG